MKYKWYQLNLKANAHTYGKQFSKNTTHKNMLYALVNCLISDFLPCSFLQYDFSYHNCSIFLKNSEELSCFWGALGSWAICDPLPSNKSTQPWKEVVYSGMPKTNPSVIFLICFLISLAEACDPRGWSQSQRRRNLQSQNSCACFWKL